MKSIDEILIPEHPIIFNGDMVNAILAGRKTQTRRIVKRQPDSCGITRNAERNRWEDAAGYEWCKCPYGKPGERLWVREAFYQDKAGFLYKANYSDEALRIIQTNSTTKMKWKPSIHMPHLAFRILLEVVSVRVERLQDITEAGAKAEGIEFDDASGGWKDYRPGYAGSVWKKEHAIKSFRTLWQTINGLASWEANIWVWVVEFKKLVP